MAIITFFLYQPSNNRRKNVCEEYKTSLQSLKAPHLIFDATGSTPIKRAVKFFTKSLALPTVSLHDGGIDELDSWNDLDVNEKDYLVQVSSPYNSIFGLLKDIIVLQNMTNAFIIYDYSVGESGQSSFLTKWDNEEFIDCEIYNGSNTPPRKNIDLRPNFKNNNAMTGQFKLKPHYRSFTMQISVVNFLHGQIQDSTSVGQWQFTDDKLKLENGHLLRDLIAAEVLRVVVVEQRPFLFMDDSHPSGFNGYLIDMMENIGAILGLDFMIELASDNTIGDSDHAGSWNGLIGDILNSKADIGLATIPVTSFRDSVIDFTIPYYRPVGSIMLMKLFHTETSLNKFIDVMEIEVWLSILAAFGVTSLLIWIFDKYNPDSDPKGRLFSFKESLWFCFLSMTPQGTGELPSNTSGRVIAVVWWIFSFIILASYTANLSAILTVSLLENPVQNIDDLEKEYKLEYAPLNGSFTMQYFSRMVQIEKLFHE
ncbi:ionotropic receptor 25a-like [Coccinella septempunctata]|uniref:ionotropic receptor 25a-like n=1 Tax=Coccinella septempunctata TaxID=41139 RepID=UPI001D08E130|nr:ionotropic receptor 25a-like [Coccinella septempunctata]